MLNSSQSNKFHGNISEDMTLANIFEQIAAGQRYGWVFLKYPDHEACLYFQGDLVGLVTPPEKKLEYIPEKLYYAGILSAQDYNEVDSSDDPLKTLEEKVPEEQVSTMLNNICYDEICSLLLRYEGYFEFVDQSHPEANRDLTPIGRMFDSEGLLMEAANREQEWKELHSSLPDWEEILVSTETEEFYSADDPMGNILHLANNRNLREIVLYSYFSEFDTIRMVSSLIYEGRLRPLTDQELKLAAAEVEAREEWERAIGYYQVLFKRSPGDIGICEALANCYEKTERTQDLAGLCYAVARNLLASSRKSDRIQGAKYLKKFSELNAKTQEEAEARLEARLQLFEMVSNQQIDPKVIEYNVLIEGNKLFQTLRSRKEDNKARQILESLLKIAPHDKNLQSQYINVCLDLKDVRSAVGQYEAIAKIYERDRNWRELASTYEKIVKLIPYRRDIAKKLEYLKKGKGKGKAKIVRKIALVFVLLLLAFGGWAGYHHFYRKPMKQQDSKESPDKGAKPGQPLDMAKIEEEIKKRDNQAKEDIEKARKALEKGKVKEAKDNLKNATLREPSDGIKKEIASVNKAILDFETDFSNKMAMIQRTMETSLESAVRLYNIEILPEEIYKELRERNPLEIPVRIEVIPSAARFTADGEAVKKEGDLLMLPITFEKLEVKLAGYASYIYYNVDKAPSSELQIQRDMHLTMEKVMEWVKDLDEPVSSPGLYQDKILYLVSGSKIYAWEDIQSSPDGPKEKWKLPLKDLGSEYSLSTTPCVYQDTLYVVGTNNVLYSVDIEKGKVKTSYKIPGSPSSDKLIDPSPGIYRYRGSPWVVLTGSDKNVHGLPLDMENPKFMVIREDIVLPPLVMGDQIVVVDHKKNVCAFGFYLDKDSKKIKKTKAWEAALRDLPNIPPVPASDDKLYIVAMKRYIYSITRGGKDVQEVYRAKSPSINRQPFIKDDVLYFTTSSIIYAVSASGEGVIWNTENNKEIEGPFTASPVVSSQNLVYVASERGIMYALSAETGELKWKKDIKLGKNARATLPPMLIGDMVIQIADRLYSFLDG